ncbi:Ribonuclease H superfamily [Babesia duncani]|uniref:Ribonuclease H superfamily n=1 Tax=Babesia duncani TaxID=323732 RepID=A0AAD9UNF2_9APIC|nr:Ribonuclease H superfamily [Babesia duncani]
MAPTTKPVIYATSRLVTVLPQLCAIGDSNAIVANVMFHCFGSQNDLNYGRQELFKREYTSALNFVFDDERWNNATNSLSGLACPRELIFAPFNRRLIHNVSPSIRPQQYNYLLSSLEASLESFALYNTKAKESINLNGLYQSIGSPEFLKLIRLLRLQHKMDSQLSSQCVNSYLEWMLYNKGEIGRVHAIEFVKLLINGKDCDIYEPLVPGSLRLLDILIAIIDAKCKVGLDLFLNAITMHAKSQVMQVLQSTDATTGLLLYPWGYMEAQNWRPVESYNDDLLNIQCLAYKNQTSTILVETIMDLMELSGHFKKPQSSQENPTLLSVHFDDEMIALCHEETVYVVDISITDVLYRQKLHKLLSCIWSCPYYLKVGLHVKENIAKLSHKLGESFIYYSNIIDLCHQRKRISRMENGQERIEFRQTGISKNLDGLLQEYNVAWYNKRQFKKLEFRRISNCQIDDLAKIARGILTIETILQKDGWISCSIHDIETKCKGMVLEKFFISHHM